MGSRWTVEHVLGLAPDSASAKAARTLAVPGTWSALGSTETLVWGKCQGSARQPYQVTVDLTEPAFRCTCPSRKFPCKHGLALLLMWAANDGAVADLGTAADFAAAWAHEREGRAARSASGTEPPADPEAQAKRQAARESVMSAGLDDFERWLFDLVRQGLAVARRQPPSFWETAAARLVDAQVPGLAERVRAMSSAVHARADWAEWLLAETGRWFLAIQAWRRRAGLDAASMGDLRTVLGWPRRTEEVLAGERIADRWQVIGLRQDVTERLQSQRTWLYGQDCGQIVVILDFAVGATLHVPHALGSVVDSEVALYPGSPPRRAVLCGSSRVVGTAKGLPATGTAAEALDRTADWLAADPWADRLPMLLSGVVAVRGDDGGVLVDQDGAILPLASDVDVWTLLALSGGHPVELFGEWVHDRLHPASMAVDHQVVPV